MKVLVIRAEEGELKEKQLADGDLEKILKDVIVKALNLWEPRKSDLVVVKHKHEVKLPLPLKKDQYELYSQFNLRRVGDSAVFEIPVYVISYENEWAGDTIRDSKVFIVTPYIDESTSANIVELAKSITSPMQEEEVEEFEEE
uniref:DUF2286 domain-containing protein n=1 Tax=Ignisphaera aggregans TaxID=334771 RepID=A0A7C2ZNW1_9CREN